MPDRAKCGSTSANYILPTEGAINFFYFIFVISGAKARSLCALLFSKVKLLWVFFPLIYEAFNMIGEVELVQPSLFYMH